MGSAHAPNSSYEAGKRQEGIGISAVGRADQAGLEYHDALDLIKKKEPPRGGEGGEARRTGQEGGTEVDRPLLSKAVMTINNWKMTKDRKSTTLC
jgi:hypothetical protein